jgi:hypothetical protein
LPTVPPGRRFHGLMGLYLRQGRLAFFRRCVGTDAGSAASAAGGEEDLETGAAATGTGSTTGVTSPQLGATEMGPWETTGFVSDLGWAEGRRLTPCLAFRDEGAYRVRVVCVGTTPPLWPERWAGDGQRRESGGDDSAGWSGFDWEVGPPALPDEVDA